MLTGPPISKALMQPMTLPRSKGLEFWRPDRKFIIASLMAVTGPAVRDMKIPIKATLTRGMRKMDLRPSYRLGRPDSIFSSQRVK